MFSVAWSKEYNLKSVYSTTENTNLCICCCICSPEAALYLCLYVFLEALGVQVVQGALAVQVHLLHLHTKHSTMSQAQQATCNLQGVHVHTRDLESSSK